LRYVASSVSNAIRTNRVGSMTPLRSRGATSHIPEPVGRKKRAR